MSPAVIMYVDDTANFRPLCTFSAWHVSTEQGCIFSECRVEVVDGTGCMSCGLLWVKHFLIKNVYAWRFAIAFFWCVCFSECWHVCKREKAGGRCNK